MQPHRLTKTLGMTILFMSFIASGIEVHADRVRTVDESIEGKITQTSRQAIRLETDTGMREIEANDVIGVLYDEEPSGLSQARINLANSGYRTVLERLDGVEFSILANPFLKDDLAFMKAEASARLAINQLADPREAGRLVVGHQKDFPTSFHYFQTVETLGDLLRSMGRFDRAVKQYDLLSKAPWSTYQAKAAYLIGLVRQQQGNHAEAIVMFNEAITLVGNSEVNNLTLQLQRIDAELAKTTSMAQTGQQLQALKQIRQIILTENFSSTNAPSAPPADEVKQYARAAGYHALGNYYLTQGNTTDALLAFLRVDYLYDQFKPIHAEALYRTVSLWNRYGEPEAAKLAQSKLRRLYPESRWASGDK